MLSPAAGGAPLFTVAICTWNRAATLRRTLESHAAQRVPAGLTWEIVVVDNNSTDETSQVLDAFAGRLPLRRVCETRVGLSHARNAAVAAARGTYVAWTDDDVFVAPDWLARYAEAVRRWPDAAVFGGPIRPRFEPAAPSWFVDALPAVGGALALLDLGPEPVPFDDERVPFGANYVVRAAEQRQHRYAPDLGRIGTGMGAGEETFVIRAILATGAAGWWVPGVDVEHLIGPERQTLAYVRRFYVGAAESAAPYVQHAQVRLFGRPRWAWRQVVERELRYRVGRIVGAPPERWAHDFVQASTALGILRTPGSGGGAGGNDGRVAQRASDDSGGGARPAGRGLFGPVAAARVLLRGRGRIVRPADPAGK